jgi:hypothetical protein
MLPSDTLNGAAHVGRGRAANETAPFLYVRFLVQLRRPNPRSAMAAKCDTGDRTLKYLAAQSRPVWVRS